MNDRVRILKDWIIQEGRKQTWVARQVGYSPQWLSYVLRGKKPLSDKLADALQQKLGVPLEARRAGDEIEPLNKTESRRDQGKGAILKE